uniref:Uncharacterized protein n=1 Tax=Fagus sylvatica TaxID=28930 RepID=A0A2N9IRE0_FAGSY
MDARHNTISVLMLPWLAHGHISPFLELAEKLTTRNIHIYFCSTPINLGPIKQKLSEKHSLSIQLVELHLPSLPDLPPHYHTTNGLPPHLMPILKKALDMASPNFNTILKKLKPDLVIYDFLQLWAPSLALSLNIPAVDFIPMSATIEIEAKYIDYLSVLSKKKIVPVGPLVQEPVHDYEENEIIEWLNKKEPSSVVFVSFGSEYFLSREEIQEMAYGLELSMVSFIWVVRFPQGDKVNLEMALPKGYLDRVGDIGMVVEGWAPQIKILEHASIGGFVSHCGWSSVMESMKFGVPIIAMPMHLDQPMNARLVEELGVGVEVKRDMNGRLEREEVAKVIRRVVVEKIGEGIGVKATELKEKIRNKGDEEIDGVVQELVQLCSKKNRQ